MISIYFVLFALRLFFGLSSHLAVAAVPAAQMDGGASEEDGLIPRDEPIMEPPLVPPMLYRRSLMLDSNMRGDDESPKIIIVSDTKLKGHSLRGPNPAFPRTLLLHPDQSLSHTAPEYSLKMERDTDIDMLRCMIGRVYRPCWKA